tara:strand:- start:2214 stop:2549 length:336 start_codon:yes stop_codon:yes gene_type:complete
MKTKIFIYIVISYAMASLLPWWVIAFSGTLIGFNSKTYKQAILHSCITLTSVWFFKLILNFFILDYIIIDKIKEFLGLSSFMIIFLTLLIPIIIGFFSSLFGHQLKKVSKS